jgi:hypothetical protein
LETFGGLEKEASDNIWDWNSQHFIVMQKVRAEGELFPYLLRDWLTVAEILGSVGRAQRCKNL